jgi:hypothetical protein
MPTTINASTSAGLVSTADTSGILQLQTANTAALTIDGSQNVGIGTASPSFRLDVVGSSPRIRVSDASTGYAINQYSNTSGSLFVGVDDSAGGAFSQGGYTRVIYSTGSYPLTFSTSSTERMRIDSSGNVGIGTSSPGAKLDVNKGSAGTLANFTDGVNTNFQISTSGFVATAGPTAGSTSLAFQTGGTERARIDSSGNLLVGTTGTGFTNRIASVSSANSSWGLFSQATASSGTVFGIRAQYIAQAPNNTANYFFFADDNSLTRFYVASNGGIYNYSANNSNLSDRREKTNFAPAGDYLAKICAIPVQTFNYIDQNLEEDDGLTLGVVAQDVQAVAPELVTEANWGTPEEPKMRLSIYQTDLQYALMKCIQEQQAIIEQLTTRIVALESK